MNYKIVMPSIVNYPNFYKLILNDKFNASSSKLKLSHNLVNRYGTIVSPFLRQ